LGHSHGMRNDPRASRALAGNGRKGPVSIARQICAHGIRQYVCRPCGGYGICEHEVQRRRCRECRLGVVHPRAKRAALLRLRRQPSPALPARTVSIGVHSLRGRQHVWPRAPNGSLPRLRRRVALCARPHAAVLSRMPRIVVLSSWSKTLRLQRLRGKGHLSAWNVATPVQGMPAHARQLEVSRCCPCFFARFDTCSPPR